MANLSSTGKKTNKAFMLLSALGILFVLDSHIGPNFSLYLVVFPYGSFYMPMFAFISGYFFSEKHIASWNHVASFTVRKIKGLLIPYFGWIVFYGIVTAIFRYFDILEIGNVSFIDLLHNIATGGTSYYFNDPAWFVPLLFCVIVGYSILRKVFRNHWNHYAAMIIFVLLGAGAVALSQTDFRTHNTFMLMKIPVFLQYYHLGVLFKEKLEVHFDRWNPILVCAAAAGVNLILIRIYGRNIEFPLYATMDGFELNAPFLPFITSITGIAFWLKLCKLLAPALGQNKCLNFISENTFFFMTHHLAVKHIWLGALIALHNAGTNLLPGVDISQYRKYAWYVYSGSFLQSSLCLLFTITALICLCGIYLTLKNAILSSTEH